MMLNKKGEEREGRMMMMPAPMPIPMAPAPAPPTQNIGTTMDDVLRSMDMGGIHG